MKQSGRCFLLLFFGVLAFPHPSHSCPYCALSGLYLTFPFMWTAVWILGIWRILAILLDWKQFSQTWPATLVREGPILVVLFCMTVQGAFFLYLFGWFLLTGGRTCIQLIRERRIPQAKWVFSLHVATFLVLIPPVVTSYVKLSQQDPLERFRIYVYPGAGFGNRMLNNIAKDRDLDVDRIGAMLESSSESDTYKAFEILWRRKNSRDLYYLRESVLKNPAVEDFLQDAHAPQCATFLSMWLEDSVGHKVETKQDLLDWFAKHQ